MNDFMFDPSDHIHDPFNNPGDHYPDTFDPDHLYNPEYAVDPFHSSDWDHSPYSDDPFHIIDPLHPLDLHPSYDDSNYHFDPSNPLGEGLDGSGPHYEHFDPATDTHGIIGDPAVDVAVWHQQAHADTCAVVSQEFIIESLTGEHVSEDSLMHEAMDHGWYTPGGGTPLDQVGDLLEDHGIHIEQEYGASLSDIADKLNHHEKVIVAVDAEDIWYHGTANDPLISYPGIPGQTADHAVEVIGINNVDPIHPLVILNDPGASDGRGIEVPADVFEQAWSTSDNFMMNTTNSATFVDASVSHSGHSALALGDAQSDADWANWDAKNAAYNASWAEYYAQRDIDNKS